MGEVDLLPQLLTAGNWLNNIRHESAELPKVTPFILPPYKQAFKLLKIQLYYSTLYEVSPRKQISKRFLLPVYAQKTNTNTIKQIYNAQKYDTYTLLQFSTRLVHLQDYKTIILK